MKKIPIKSLENVPDEELKIQYKLFLEKLEKITENIEKKYERNGQQIINPDFLKSKASIQKHCLSCEINL